MQGDRREFLKYGTGAAAAAGLVTPWAAAQPAAEPGTTVHNVRTYGATGDGKTIDTPAVNHAI